MCAKDIADSLEKLQAEIRGLKLTPPGDDAWWHTVRGKIGAASTLQADAMALKDTMSKSLYAQMKTVTKTNEYLGNLAKEAARQEELLQAKLVEIEQANERIQSLIDTYAQPFSLFGARTDEVVLVFPIMLMAVAAWLSWRYGVLARQSAWLELEFCKRGVSPDISSVVFSSFGPTHKIHVAILLALLTAVILIDLYWLANSRVLQSGIAWRWVAVSAIGYCAASVFALLPQATSPRSPHLEQPA